MAANLRQNLATGRIAAAMAVYGAAPMQGASLQMANRLGKQNGLQTERLTMRAYVIVQESVHDLKTFDEYRKDVVATLAPFHGRFLVRGGKVTMLEGDKMPERTVLLEFPSRARGGRLVPLGRLSEDPAAAAEIQQQPFLHLRRRGLRRLETFATPTPEPTPRQARAALGALGAGDVRARTSVPLWPCAVCAPQRGDGP